MTKDELIKCCRYYKGEKECPYKGNSALMWDYERRWCNEIEADSDHSYARMVKYYKEDGLEDFHANENPPISLKALLYSRYGHWIDGSVESFKEWYDEFYLGESK